MSTKHLRNISLSEHKLFLEKFGCKCIRTKGGHEHWSHRNCDRPITLQTHISPVPEFIIKQHIRLLGIDRKQYLKILFDL